MSINSTGLSNTFQGFTKEDGEKIKSYKAPSNTRAMKGAALQSPLIKKDVSVAPIPSEARLSSPKSDEERPVRAGSSASSISTSSSMSNSPIHMQCNISSPSRASNASQAKSVKLLLSEDNSYKLICNDDLPEKMAEETASSLEDLNHGPVNDRMRSSRESSTASSSLASNACSNSSNETSVNDPDCLKDAPSTSCSKDQMHSTKNAIASCRSTLEKFQVRQKMMEEQNKRRKELLIKALADRKKQTHLEAEKLVHIQEELNLLDARLSNDVAILRNQIELSSYEFNEAQKRYDKAESDFIEAKLQLFNKMERKELLTEHLCRIIEANEQRKSRKLSELMAKMELVEMEKGKRNNQSLNEVFEPLSHVDEVTYAACTTLRHPNKAISKGISARGASSAFRSLSSSLSSSETLQNGEENTFILKEKLSLEPKGLGDGSGGSGEGSGSSFGDGGARKGEKENVGVEEGERVIVEAREVIGAKGESGGRMPQSNGNACKNV